MKKSIALTALLFTACTTRIEVLDDTGTHPIDVKKVRTNEIVTSESSSNPVQAQESCTHPGICMTCGITVGLKMTCGVHFFLNCPGSRDVTFVPVLETFHRTYETDKGEFRSPDYTRTAKRYTSQGECK